MSQFLSSKGISRFHLAAFLGCFRPFSECVERAVITRLSNDIIGITRLSNDIIGNLFTLRSLELDFVFLKWGFSFFESETAIGAIL